jgi:hypothetical protein
MARESKLYREMVARTSGGDPAAAEPLAKSGSP